MNVTSSISIVATTWGTALWDILVSALTNTVLVAVVLGVAFLSMVFYAIRRRSHFKV